MITLKMVQYFAACAEKSSFSEAARELYTTQPNVSKVIRSLEDELGYPLFERSAGSAGGIRLTEDGKRVRVYTDAICRELQALGALKRTGGKREER